MKTVRKFSGGGIHDDRGPRQRELDRQRKAKRIKELEGLIAEVRGTSAATPLVQEYRMLTGTQKK